MKDASEIQVVKLQVIVMQQPTEEGMARNSETTVEEGAKHDHLALFRDDTISLAAKRHPTSSWGVRVTDFSMPLDFTQGAIIAPCGKTWRAFLGLLNSQDKGCVSALGSCT